MNNSPVEILLSISKHSDRRDLFTLSHVNQKWRSVCLEKLYSDITVSTVRVPPDEWTSPFNKELELYFCEGNATAIINLIRQHKLTYILGLLKKLTVIEHDVEDQRNGDIRIPNEAQKLLQAVVLTSKLSHIYINRKAKTYFPELFPTSESTISWLVGQIPTCKVEYRLSTTRTLSKFDYNLYQHITRLDYQASYTFPEPIPEPWLTQGPLPSSLVELGINLAQPANFRAAVSDLKLKKLAVTFHQYSNLCKMDWVDQSNATLTHLAIDEQKANQDISQQASAIYHLGHKQRLQNVRKLVLITNPKYTFLSNFEFPSLEELEFTSLGELPTGFDLRWLRSSNKLQKATIKVCLVQLQNIVAALPSTLTHLRIEIDKWDRWYTSYKATPHYGPDFSKFLLLQQLDLDCLAWHSNTMAPYVASHEYLQVSFLLSDRIKQIGGLSGLKEHVNDESLWQAQGDRYSNSIISSGLSSSIFITQIDTIVRLLCSHRFQMHRVGDMQVFNPVPKRRSLLEQLDS